ncbi:NAD(P)-dependent oxidoreductase [Alkalihalophilus marmarensis]|jgi:3-hydroxyisobutyrate dehydrogenase|uniref:Oxidoreductase n=1 Tax=Alkalihalophilus marmarensis DSM 21297 TaxID=1188261 RepID=U6SL89_9BACI|nr:NAD(P)-dependent oxidoreductase [Alkalihalophilus marmarensis]ERN51695.1 oxidoreductase [Alkalihalophilus marmarensis DSM 21297]MCM3491625.1 NAD(P)-dependent oxidoreductase [Alkalihalophilus marmarensis]
MDKVKSIGFIGLGVMGKSMAKNLMKKGFSVNAYTRTKSKAEDLIEEGCTWCESSTEVAGKADVIITMLGFPSEVKEIYFGEEGLLNKARKGSILIDMSTSSPTLAKEIAEAADKHQMTSLDAPVSGGDIGAREARLTIMVGGNEEAYNKVLPVFQAMGTNVVLQGGPGMGQYTKMVNQIAIATNMIGVSEAISYADKAGLNPNLVLKSIGGGAAGSWSLSNLAPRMIAGDYEPGFYIKHFVKDMTIALESAEELGLDTPGLKLAKGMYEKLVTRGFEDAGTQALIKLYVDQA